MAEASDGFVYALMTPLRRAGWPFFDNPKYKTNKKDNVSKLYLAFIPPPPSLPAALPRCACLTPRVTPTYACFATLACFLFVLPLRPRYCYRLILNEALSFGVLGATGRGLMEMHGVDVSEVEIVALSMAHSLASVGGLCIGTTQVQQYALWGTGWAYTLICRRPSSFHSSLLPRVAC